MIDFINPLYLLLVAAGVIPLLIHLFQRHRARVVEFSSIRLLKGSERKTIRWVRLRQILLLLLRSLIIVLIVLALSHPLMKGIVKEKISTHLPTSVLLIVDNSMSMGWTDEEGSLLDKSIKRARQVLDELNEDDNSGLLFLGELGGESVIIEGIDEIREILDEIETVPMRLDISRLIMRGKEKLEEMPGPYREIHIFTDLQASSFGMENGGVDVESDIHLVFFTEKESSTWNRAVTRIELEEGPISPDGRIYLKGEVVERGMDSPERRVIVGIRPEAGEQYLQEVTLDKEGKGTFPFSLSSTSGDVIRGYVEVDPDPLAMDNRRYFTVRLPGRPRVWFPGDEDRGSPLGTAIRILGEKAGSVELKRSLPVEILDNRDLIVLEAPSGAIIERLRPLISRNLGEASVIIIPPGSEEDISRLNDLLSLMGLPDRYMDLAGSERGEYVKVGKWSSMTGEMGRFVNEYLEEFSTLKFTRYFSLYGGNGDKGDEIIEFDSREPWILMREAWGGGWRVMLSTGFGRWWGDFYRHPLFVPFIDTLFRDIVSRGGLSNFSFGPGEMVILDIPGVIDGVGIDLLTPEGEKNRVYPDSDRLKYRAGSSPGNYRFTILDKDAGGFSVNTDRRESLLEEISGADLSSALGGLEIEIVRSGEGLEEKILIERGGSDIWWELLFLSLLLLFVEGAVANRGKR